MNAVVALPFAADACLIASLFEADADDADDATELVDDAAAAFEDSALVSDVFVFALDVFAAEADLAIALACTAASPVFAAITEADDATLSTDFPTAAVLAEACSALVDAILADNVVAVFESAVAEALCPVVVSEDLTFASNIFAAFAEFAAAVVEEAALLTLETTFVSDDFAASFKASAPHTEVTASDAFVIVVDIEVAANCCDAAVFVSDVFAVLALVAATLFDDSAAAALFAASRTFVDAVPTLEDADWTDDAACPADVLAVRIEAAASAA